MGTKAYGARYGHSKGDNRTALTATCPVCMRADVGVRDGVLSKHLGSGMGTCDGSGVEV